MHELAERADLVRLHSFAQGLSAAETTRILSRIATIDDGPAGWATVWSQEGSRCLSRDDKAGAIARFNLARFPYPHTDDGHAALRKCVAVAGEAASAQGLCRIEADGAPAWYQPAPGATSGPNLLVLCGGIVSVKEQWLSMAEIGRRLSMAILLTELPGVGENTNPYAADAPARLSSLLDAVERRNRFGAAFLLAMSFGGTVALQAAGSDPRIGEVFSVGPPIRHFFTDPLWWERTPQTTKDALSATTGKPVAALPDFLPSLALTDEQLRRIRVPVTDIVSLRDEIVPRKDPELLESAVPTARTIAFDDVHGSPGHVQDTKAHIAAALAGFAARHAESAL
ncbi:conserved hypothetical protein [Segniliparus rotundus DSM 44985]|uniref:AB hydrolase-1 domain-containing protein n=1 Tax=Segniliparus rotundus (strain ATCC BAA-972 / CDC 1076 / CIP 108378 / DSM 44985 / JCM 13578) TaxID=640132 RepID=D6ZEG7_SEGRD|nr:alpha/beta fold hydrolase [Segniliparus rotundus]ADG99443.1 conserved hypothetical protein [Segniliparus rotundus DSM 44985]